MITLALDISTHSTGAAIFNGRELIHYECIAASSTNTFNPSFTGFTVINVLLVVYWSPAPNILHPAGHIR